MSHLGKSIPDVVCAVYTKHKILDRKILMGVQIQSGADAEHGFNAMTLDAAGKVNRCCVLLINPGRTQPPGYGIVIDRGIRSVRPNGRAGGNLT